MRSLKSLAAVAALVILAACGRTPEEQVQPGPSAAENAALRDLEKAAKEKVALAAKAAKKDEDDKRLDKDKAEFLKNVEFMRGGNIPGMINLLQNMVTSTSKSLSGYGPSLLDVATTFTYKLVPNSQWEQRKDVSFAFWDWAIKNPAKLDQMMSAAKPLAGQAHEIIAELRGQRLFLSNKFDLSNLSLFATCKDDEEEDGLCKDLAKTYGPPNPSSRYLAEFLMRRYNNGGMPMAEKFRGYILDLVGGPLPVNVKTVAPKAPKKG